jgi:glycosyltransferase involved in cell wall biosynthesis
MPHRSHLGRYQRSRPRVTLITVTLNAARTLARTIESVQAQTFQDIEHVVVDGGSRDGTRELLRSMLRPQDTWISEPDDGISDAFNKGLALAAGDYLQFINADDWLSPDQVALAVAALEATGADFVFGDLIFYQGGRPAFRFSGDAQYHRSIRRRMPALNHPTALVRRTAFERVGMFDPVYRCAMDYDWFLRLHLAGGRGVHVRGLVGHMNHDGVSNIDYARTFREVEAIAVRHGRNAKLARIERICRLVKTRTARQLRGPAQPLYRIIRRHINRSYVPIDTSAADAPRAPGER